MRDCEFVQTHIDDWLDGGLDLTSADRFDDHIAACESCRALVEREHLISLDLESLGGAANRIAQDGQIAEHPPHRRRRVWPAAAAIVLLVSGGYVATWLTKDTPAERNGNGRDIVRKPVDAEPIQLSIVLPDDDSRMTVRMPSDDPQVKIIWLYETTQTRSNSPGDADSENAGPGDAVPMMNRS